MRRIVGAGLALGFTLACSASAAAYPERPIRLAVPVAAGGGNDIVARLIAQKLTESWGRQVVVGNRPGAATADGYTIMLTSVSFAINASVNEELSFDCGRYSIDGEP